jgi:hypothetical protein
MIRVCVYAGPKWILLWLPICWAHLDSRLCIICAVVMCGVSKNDMIVFWLIWSPLIHFSTYGYCELLQSCVLCVLSVQRTVGI